MSGPLVYLLLATRKNALRRFLAGLRVPRKALGSLGTLALAGFVAWSVAGTARSPEEARAAAAPLLRAYLGLVLVMSLLGGLSERGIPFRPADVHFLFPGPFTRGRLVLYHLADQAPVAGLGAVLPFLFFGWRAPHPVLALWGCVAAILVAQHVRVFASLAMVAVGERVFRRMRGPLRLLLMAGGIGLVALLATAATRAGGLREIVRPASSGPARFLLYPATVAGDLAEAPSAGDALLSALGALAAVLATLVAVLVLQVNFLEESIGVSERNAARRARLRRSRNIALATAPERPARAVRLPALAIFRGAGAIAWKNLIVARRSTRALFFAAVMASVVLTPVLASAGGGPPLALGSALLLSLLLSGSFVFDFRGEGGNVAALKVLPLSRASLALAEVAVPSALTLLFQGIYLLLVVATGRAESRWALLTWVGCVPVTATLVAATNLTWFFAPRGSAAGLLHMLFVLADLAGLGVLAWGLYRLGAPLAAMAGVLFAGQVAMFVGLLMLLARAFDARDVADDGD